MTDPLVSITVCVRDGAHFVEDCLSALAAQTWRPLEIIAVDDGSSDDSLALLEKWRDEAGEVRIRVLGQDAIGLSAARNHALDEAAGEWVAITDIDCRPEPHWISEMMVVREGLPEADENIVAVTGRTIFGRGETRTSRIRAAAIDAKYASRPRLASLANGPCSIFRAEALRAIGGFDPAWYHAEDMEVSLRLIREGGLIVHCASAVVHHVPESSLATFLRKRSRDARAHMRIRRIYGAKGVIKRDGSLHPHDFTSDASTVVGLIPNRLILAGLGVGLSLVTPLPWWALAAIGALDLARRPIHTLWCAALWHGALLGGMDALLGRNGHPGLFTRPRSRLPPRT